MRKYPVLLMFLMIVTLSSRAESDAEKVVRLYNTAHALEQSGKYKDAMDLYLQAYELGEKNFAPMKLAEFYALGEGTAQNFEESDKWLRIAADNGNAKAQSMVGDRYYYAHDLQESAKWYLKSAEQGYADGEFKIALAYLDGEGVIQSDSLGVSWLKKAAENEHPDAQDAMAIICGFGKNGVQKDEREFVKWAMKAAQNGNPQSQFRVGNIYLYGIGGVKINKSEAIKWFKLAAEQGEPNAITKLAELGY